MQHPGKGRMQRKTRNMVKKQASSQTVVGELDTSKRIGKVWAFKWETMLMPQRWEVRVRKGATFLPLLGDK